MKPLPALLALTSLFTLALAGETYRDAAHAGGPQKIPGAVFCAYFDVGGEGVAYHDTDAVNSGSGKLNPADGTYLNEFRMKDGLDTSYTKQLPDLDSPCNKVIPPLGLLYVGWNEPGEWFNVTVEAAKAGSYAADLLYTANRNADISISVNGGEPVAFLLTSTSDPAETIAWRQWHHWNVLNDIVTLKLGKGVNVLTLRIVTGGNCNLATLLFRPTDAPRTGPAITTLLTPLPAR